MHSGEQGYTDFELIEIIDHPKYMDTSQRMEALHELNSRDLSPERTHKLAVEVNEKIAYELISIDPILKDAVAMHESSFLDKDEIRHIYIDQLEKYIKYKDQFRFDVWAYAIGGI